MMTIELAWWRMGVEPGWRLWQDEVCVTAVPPEGDAALQISAYRKQDGDVPKEKLLADATRHAPDGCQPVESGAGVFSGYSIRYEEEAIIWEKWFVANGPILIFVSYNRGAEEEVHDSAVDAMLDTLQRGPAV